MYLSFATVFMNKWGLNSFWGANEIYVLYYLYVPALTDSNSYWLFFAIFYPRIDWVVWFKFTYSIEKSDLLPPTMLWT